MKEKQTELIVLSTVAFIAVFSLFALNTDEIVGLSTYPAGQKVYSQAKIAPLSEGSEAVPELDKIVSMPRPKKQAEKIPSLQKGCPGGLDTAEGDVITFERKGWNCVLGNIDGTRPYCCYPTQESRKITYKTFATA